ncbi:hypothetical protein A3K64_00725 [Candidatus Micrarchaeota archaeon RBG_16_36_9]|nr:MAG: hypothetical protein A3K64_00725 [Candidatus Micrarchaeota archaeon RBG_16_36_9]
MISENLKEPDKLKEFLKEFFRKAYYLAKPIIPRSTQIAVRRRKVKRQLGEYADIWPIDPASGEKPVGWTGWPEGKQFALILTHDVDTAIGQSKCMELSRLESNLSLNSAFNIVPERYLVNMDVMKYLSGKGHEIGVHDLKHDGHLYDSEKIFWERAQVINNYMQEWEMALGEPVSGFRSGAMHHNLKWLLELGASYNESTLHDESTFDTDPFEPNPEGMRTIFPFSVKDGKTGKKYIEIPYTLPQDFTMFVLMPEEMRTTDTWKKKLAWVAEKGGMALVNVHPDYMNFLGNKCGREQYPARLYKEFLEHVSTEYKGHFWHALPRDVKTLWKDIQTPHDRVYNPAA